MATTNMITLAWFVTPWRANIIEPFTCNSKYFGIPHRYKRTFSLFYLFDYQMLNKLLCQHNISHIVRYNDFLKHASRRVILIHILYDGFDLTRFGGPEVSRKEITSLLHKEGSHYSNCSHTTYMKRIGRGFLKWIHFVVSTRFEIVHYCCVNGSHPTYSKEMADKCHIPREDRNVTVVFTDWRGLSSKKNFRVFVPEADRVDMPHPSRDLYPYSSYIVSNASAFLLSVTNGMEFIGIHLRTEKLGQVNEGGYFINCLRKSQAIKQNILSNFSNNNINVLYFADIGPFGSKSCTHKCLSNKFISSSFAMYEIKVTQYNPKLFGGIVDSGFVAAVEQETLSRAKVLVLVGGGSFEAQVATRYRHYRGQKPHSIHQVCVP